MTSSEFENYVKIITEVVPEVTQLIRELFYNKFQYANGKPWINSQACGIALVLIVGKTAWTSASQRQKKLMAFGDAELWDYNLLSHILLNVNFGEASLMIDERNEINQMKMLLRKIKSMRKGASNNDYQEICGKAKLLQTVFNIVPKISPPEDSKDIISRYALQVIESKEYCNSNEFQKMIEIFTRCIEEETSNNLKGVSFCNRAFCHMEMAYMANNLAERFQNAKLALEDATRTIQLCPSWFRPYFRLGCAYKHLAKYEKAIICFDIAAYLDENQYETTAIKAHRRGCARRLEEVQAKYKSFSLKSYKNALASTRVTIRKSQIYLKSHPELSLLGNEIFYVVKAFCYLHGFEDIKQNRDEAVKLLKWIASNGDCPAASYYLGLLDGLQDNFIQAYLHFSHAATREMTKNETVKYGVAESEYELALIFEKGLGVLPNLEEAIRWCKRAADNGNRLAAYRLKDFYLNGRGVEPCKTVDFKIVDDREFNERMKTLVDICTGNKSEALRLYKKCFSYIGMILSKEFVVDLNGAIQQKKKVKTVKV